MNDRRGYGDAEVKQTPKRRRAIITAVIIAAVVVVYALLRMAGPLSP